MDNNARIPKTEITGIYGGLLKVAMRRMIGEVPDSAEVMWQNPQVFKDMMGFSRKTEKWERVDPNLASFAGMAAASQIGCSFCLDLGYFMTHNKGLDVAKAREVPRWRESDVFTPLGRRVMEYAEAMSQTPPTVTDFYDFIERDEAHDAIVREEITFMKEKHMAGGSRFSDSNISALLGVLRAFEILDETLDEEVRAGLGMLAGHKVRRGLSGPGEVVVDEGYSVSAPLTDTRDLYCYAGYVMSTHDGYPYVHVSLESEPEVQEGKRGSRP